MLNPTTYFAQDESEAFAQEAWSRIGAYYEFLRSSEHFARISKAFRYMYGVSGRDGTSWRLQRDGAKGELVRLQSGDFRNLAEHRVTIATQHKPTWNPIATNSDFASLTQTTLASGLLDYYWREKRVQRYLHRAVRQIQWAGEGFIFGGWDISKGEAVFFDPESGQEEKAGDLWFFNPSTRDVARDPFASSWEVSPWKAVRQPICKWDLAAQYPEKTEEILCLQDNPFDPLSGQPRKTDEVSIWHFFHERTPACPNGRYAILGSDKTVLMDLPMLPYRRVPLIRLVEDEIEGTPFGYTAMWDTMGPLEAADKLSAAILSQQMAHAIPKIIGVKGSGLSYKMLATGLAYIEVNSMEQKPETLDLAEVNAQIFQFREALKAEAQEMANLNDVARGVVDESIKSGAHAALYDAIAQRGANALQEAYFSGCEDIGTFVLHTLADYAGDSERTARIIGEHNRQLVYTFTSDDLQDYERVTVEAVDSATKTALGKQAIADKLLDKGALGQGEIAGAKYITLVKTGELEQTTEAPQSNILRLKRDKEMLSKGIGPMPMQPTVDPLTGAPMLDAAGKPILQAAPEPGATYLPILETDPHWLDIPEYLTVLGSTEARQNADVIRAVTDAVMVKLEMWRNMSPDLIFLLGGQPAPTTMSAPGMPGDTSGTPPPAPGGSNSTGPGPELPQQPQLPTNPATGQEHEMASGGLPQ